MINGLFNTIPKRIKKDSGEEVQIWDVPLKRFYRNSEMERLSQEYDIRIHTGPVPSSLGDAGHESVIADLFKVYQMVGGLCGLVDKELEIFAKQSGHPYDLGSLLPQEKKPKRKEEKPKRKEEKPKRKEEKPKRKEDLFSLEKIEGINIIYPTEQLLINQRVPKRSEGYYLERNQLPVENNGIPASNNPVRGLKMTLYPVTRQ